MPVPPSPDQAAREAAIHRYYRSTLFAVITGGFAFFEAMYCAARLGLFPFLAKNPASSMEKIAQGLGLAVYPTRVLLMTCASMNLVRVEGGLFSNEPES